MCGISGFFGHSPVDLQKYYRAHSVLGHRGPDDEGFLVIRRVGDVPGPAYGKKTIPEKRGVDPIFERGSAVATLGHHRLSVLDLSEGGHQPLYSQCGRYAIVYNGEIYNYLEIKRELQALGVTFQTNSDTEVLIEAFARFGPDCFLKFNGMWALVILDLEQRKVTFSRDRFGVKPLYYSIEGGTLYFGSELKFFKAMGLSLSLDRERAYDYLDHCLLDYDERTLYSEVRAIPPAVSIEVPLFEVPKSHANLSRPRTYWRLPLQVDYGATRKQQAVRLREILQSSINLRMRSDVPVGVLLSGGLDSTTIATYLSRHDSLVGGRLRTFSAIFEEPEFSEENYIRDTLRFLPQLQGEWIRPSTQNLIEDFGLLLDTIETPFRSLAAYSQFCIYRSIRADSPVKVLLNGQGSDELFGGYRAHYGFYLGELLSQGRLAQAVQELRWARHYRGNEVFNYASRGLKTAAKSFAERFWHSPFQSKKRGLPIYKDQNAARAYPIVGARSLSEQLALELKFSALPEYLRYEDRNSTRFGLEARLPFLDYRLVEFAFSLPSEFKIHDGINKAILREAVVDDITPSVSGRKDKMGFVSPQEKWQRTALRSWMDDILMHDDPSGLFNQDQLARAPLSSWERWRVFCFKVWYQRSFNA